MKNRKNKISDENNLVTVSFPFCIILINTVINIEWPQKKDWNRNTSSSPSVTITRVPWADSLDMTAYMTHGTVSTWYAWPTVTFSTGLALPATHKWVSRVNLRFVDTGYCYCLLLWSQAIAIVCCCEHKHENWTHPQMTKVEIGSLHGNVSTWSVSRQLPF